METKELGIFGENIALNYLKKKGYKILDKNYFKKWVSGPFMGEIDIIAQKNDIISFIEVKTVEESSSKAVSCFSPEQKVNFLKQKKLLKIAQNWLTEKKNPLNIKWQIDIIGIKVDLNLKRAKIRHFRNAVF